MPHIVVFVVVPEKRLWNIKSRDMRRCRLMTPLETLPATIIIARRLYWRYTGEYTLLVSCHVVRYNSARCDDVTLLMSHREYAIMRTTRTTVQWNHCSFIFVCRVLLSISINIRSISRIYKKKYSGCLSILTIFKSFL